LSIGVEPRLDAQRGFSPTDHRVNLLRTLGVAAALDFARKHYPDVLIVDTAGRLAIDEDMMREIRELHAALKPVETLATAPGVAFNWIAVPVVAVALYLSVCPAEGSS
jgi:hypothetical protein